MTFDIDKATGAMVLEDSYAYPTRYHAELALLDMYKEIKIKQLWWEIDRILKAELARRILVDKTAQQDTRAHKPTDGENPSMENMRGAAL